MRSVCKLQRTGGNYAWQFGRDDRRITYVRFLKLIGYRNTHSNYLVIVATSPEKKDGKSRLLEMLNT